MNHMQETQEDAVAEVLNAKGTADMVLVCEHASHFIPRDLQDLGLGEAARISHAAWDPGAAPVAKAMADMLDAPLVASRVSRLVYDCNRPPEAPDAMPARSEIFDIPGNASLGLEDRRQRAEKYYEPFRLLLSKTLADKLSPAVVTVHSFTPVYMGETRSVELGVLHDADTRLADAMLETAADHSRYVVRRNEPYGPQDGVTHTLKEHALRQKRINVMIEIRNDLIATPAQQQAMAALLSGWLTDALDRCGGRRA